MYPTDFMYSKSHEWVRFNGDEAIVGLTDYAQGKLGGIVFVGLPEEGDFVEAGCTMADVESIKAVSEIYAPISGEVAEINEELLEAPELINEAPYEAWLVKITSITEQEDLLTAEEYEEFIKTLE
ncbi:MAG: glycine cleavage system protein GcvH [Lachnospiraceae bacterium]